jgi:hypothetical protein
MKLDIKSLVENNSCSLHDLAPSQQYFVTGLGGTHFGCGVGDVIMEAIKGAKLRREGAR